MESKVRLTRNETTITGILKGNRDKKLNVTTYGLGILSFDARDQWNVEYETLGFDEVMRAAPVGTVWRDKDEAWPRFVKVSETHCTKQAFRDGMHSDPVVHPIILFGGPADQFYEIGRNVLEEAADR